MENNNNPIEKITAKTGVNEEETKRKNELIKFLAKNINNIKYNKWYFDLMCYMIFWPVQWPIVKDIAQDRVDHKMNKASKIVSKSKLLSKKKGDIKK